MTDADTGQWKAIKYGGAYGTNGFFLEFDSSTGGSSFADSSSFAQTVTQSGAVWNSPAQKKIGDSSIKFDGGYLRLAADSEYAVANNWTMECWVYCTQDPASGGGWHLTLRRCRGATISRDEWKVRYNDATGHLALAAEAGDRPDATADRLCPV